MIKVRPIVPRSLSMFAPAKHKQAIERTMKMAEEKALGEIEAITRDWSKPPQVEVRRQGDITGIIVADVRWTYLDEGTRAHAIIARRKRALYWPGAAHPVKRVNHPGIRARYLTKQVQRKVDALNLAQTFSNIVGGLK